MKRREGERARERMNMKTKCNSYKELWSFCALLAYMHTHTHNDIQTEIKRKRDCVSVKGSKWCDVCFFWLHCWYAHLNEYMWYMKWNWFGWHCRCRRRQLLYSNCGFLSHLPSLYVCACMCQFFISKMLLHSLTHLVIRPTFVPFYVFLCFIPFRFLIAFSVNRFAFAFGLVLARIFIHTSKQQCDN